MKKAFALLLTAAVVLGLNACGGSPRNKHREVFAIALNEDGGSLLFYMLNGANSSLVSVRTEDAELIAFDGTAISASDFETGQLVNITYDGVIAESYPGQIHNCYKIQITGEADVAQTAEAFNRYMSVNTREGTVYYVDETGALAEKPVSITFGDYFGLWKEVNGISEDVRLLWLSMEDNGYEETNGDIVTYYAATTADYRFDLSLEFQEYLSSATNENMVVASLVKTIIANSPHTMNIGVFLTVGGNPFITKKNDFSGRLSFDM